jgi:hypothetical protein
MRVAEMGYTQRVTTKDKQGRITSSWLRVRVVVPDGLPQSLPPPYTGNRNLTKKVHTDREHAEWTERFLAMIEGARGWDTIHRELAAVNGLSLEGFIARGCIPVFAKLDRKIDGILGEPPCIDAVGTKAETSASLDSRRDRIKVATFMGTDRPPSSAGNGAEP